MRFLVRSSATAAVVALSIGCFWTSPSGAAQTVVPSGSFGSSAQSWVATLLSPPVASTNLAQPGRTIVRDGGFSTPTDQPAAPSLWLFDDTAIYDPNGECFVADGSGAVAPVVPGQAPSLIEATQAGFDSSNYGGCAGHQNIPYQSISVPPACVASGIAHAWATGLTTTGGTLAPSSTAIVTYADQCFRPLVTTGSYVAAYQVANAAPQVIVPSQARQALLYPYIPACGSAANTSGWQSPVVFAGYLYLFNVGQSNPRGSTSGECGIAAVARAPLAQDSFLSASSYEYLTSAGTWSPDIARAGSILPSTGSSAFIGTVDGEVSVAQLENGQFAMAYLAAGDTGSVTFRTAPTPLGPWSVPAKLAMPSGFNAAGGINYQVVIHPELSTPSQIVISYATWKGQIQFASAPLSGLPSPVVSGQSSRSVSGYWSVSADGSVAASGSVQSFGTPVGLKAPIVAMAPTADSRGYWLAASDGGIFTFGDAGFYGSTGGSTGGDPVVAVMATPDSRGYWELASTGAAAAFGDAVATP